MNNSAIARNALFVTSWLANMTSVHGVEVPSLQHVTAFVPDAGTLKRPVLLIMHINQQFERMMDGWSADKMTAEPTWAQYIAYFITLIEIALDNEENNDVLDAAASAPAAIWRVWGDRYGVPAPPHVTGRVSLQEANEIIGTIEPVLSKASEHIVAMRNVLMSTPVIEIHFTGDDFQEFHETA